MWAAGREQTSIRGATGYPEGGRCRWSRLMAGQPRNGAKSVGIPGTVPFDLPGQYPSARVGGEVTARIRHPNWHRTQPGRIGRKGCADRNRADEPREPHSGDGTDRTARATSAFRDRPVRPLRHLSASNSGQTQRLIAPSPRDPCLAPEPRPRLSNGAARRISKASDSARHMIAARTLAAGTQPGHGRRRDYLSD